MRTLKHDDMVILNGRKGTVGTVRGMATKYPVGSVNEKSNTDPEADVARARGFGHAIYWINQEAGMLCSDKGYYERQRAIWADAVEVFDGEVVMIEGDVRTIKYKGNYSDMGAFIEV